jgi:hypothetical protein
MGDCRSITQLETKMGRFYFVLAAVVRLSKNSAAAMINSAAGNDIGCR